MLGGIYTIVIGGLYILYRLAKESIPRPIDNHMNGHTAESSNCYMTAEERDWFGGYLRSINIVEEGNAIAAELFDSVFGLEGLRLVDMLPDYTQANQKIRTLLIAIKMGLIPYTHSWGPFCLWPTYTSRDDKTWPSETKLTEEQRYAMIKWVQTTLRQNGNDIQFIYRDIGTGQFEYTLAPRFGDEWKYVF